LTKISRFLHHFSFDFSILDVKIGKIFVFREFSVLFDTMAFVNESGNFNGAGHCVKQLLNYAIEFEQ